MKDSRKNKIRVSTGRKIFLALNYLFFTLIILICSYPLWYVFVQSLSKEFVAGKGVIIPNGFTLRNYQQVMKLKGIGSAFKISALRTVLTICTTRRKP